MTSSRKEIVLECNTPIELHLGGNSLRFMNENGWVSDSNDINIAAEEITQLVTQNENFVKTLEQANEEILSLKRDQDAGSLLKKTVMDMIIEEREKNLRLERELAVYKEKLRESYRVILDLPQVEE